MLSAKFKIQFILVKLINGLHVQSVLPALNSHSMGSIYYTSWSTSCRQPHKVLTWRFPPIGVSLLSVWQQIAVCITKSRHADANNLIIGSLLSPPGGGVPGNEASWGHVTSMWSFQLQVEEHLGV